MSDAPVSLDDEPPTPPNPGSVGGSGFEAGSEPAGNANEPALIDCWRCGKLVDETVPTCPYCRARLHAESAEPSPPRAAPNDQQGQAIGRVLIVYSVMLAIALAFSLVSRFGSEADAPDQPVASVEDGLNAILALELIDIGLIVAAVFWIPKRPGPDPLPPRRRLAGWAASVPLLLVPLAINVAYNQFLRQTFHLPLIDIALLAEDGWSARLFVALCLQPAIFEELFFRHLVLDSLRAPIGTHTAVLASSLMFGLAHIGTPLNIPVLTLFGVALGYGRILSGSLIPPMLMHLFHNAAVLYLLNPR